jgi:argininosuccinate synthase
MVLQRKALYSLYRADLATFNTDVAYDHDDADGFIKLYGLPLRVKAQMDQQRASRTPTSDVKSGPAGE